MIFAEMDWKNFTCIYYGKIAINGIYPLTIFANKHHPRCVNFWNQFVSLNITNKKIIGNLLKNSILVAMTNLKIVRNSWNRFVLTNINTEYIFALIIFD